MLLKGRKSTKLLRATADQKFLGYLEKKGLQKSVSYLMANKNRKELKSIATTGTRKAMKKVPAKAQKTHKLGVNFFCK
jgi:hypothetical protein